MTKTFDIITLFPEMFQAFIDSGVLGRARRNGIVGIGIHDLRPFGIGRHNVVDDAPFGGGDGMVMMVEPIARAIEAALGEDKTRTHVVLTSPQGRRFDMEVARELAEKERIAIICGRYAGVDERVREALVDDEISIGDYVLSGGEIAAMTIVDAVSRFEPGVLGNEDSAENDSFPYLLEEAQYTRPRKWRGLEPPEVLLSGDHARIERWRAEDRLRRTRERRPDLYKKAEALLGALEAGLPRKKKKS